VLPARSNHEQFEAFPHDQTQGDARMSQPRAYLRASRSPSRTRLQALLAVLLLGIGAPAAAQQIYKSVDADGVVSYSSSPPRDAPQDRIETVKVDPAPPEAERNAAQQRLSEMQRQSSGSARNADRSSRQSAKQDADASSTTGTDSWDQWRSGVVERSRSNSRVARPAGAGSTESGRSTGQPASGRSSR
jgi:hypothetical protein